MPTKQPDQLLWYFADPMCSWCWGFTPVIDEIKKHYSDDLKIALVLGGLRPFSSDALESVLRHEILHHWHEVHNCTGQAFNFEDAMPTGFVYDTEPASRAIVTIGEIKPDAVFAYFKTIQSGFYVHQRDVTQQDILMDMAGQFEVDLVEFQSRFQSYEIKNKTLSHFHKARAYDVRGFPSLILENKDGQYGLAHGYRTFDELRPEIDTWLA